jgi:hypothetical protein
MTTPYEQMKASLQKRKGRKPLPEEEKARRNELQKRENARRAEARRRANVVLSHKYEEEFKVLFNEEYSALESDKRFVKTV